MERRASTALPYVVMGEMFHRDGTRSTWVLARRKHLRTAIKYAHDLAYGWLRLIGNQASPLNWYVVDTRDYAEYRNLSMEGLR